MAVVNTSEPLSGSAEPAPIAWVLYVAIVLPLFLRPARAKATPSPAAAKLGDLDPAVDVREAELDEPATGNITGEEEALSHTDLNDFQANVDGSKAAIQSLRAVLTQRDRTLAARRPTCRGHVQALHRPVEGPGQGAFASAVDALSELMAR